MCVRIKVRRQLMGVDSLLQCEPWGLKLVLRLGSKDFYLLSHMEDPESLSFFVASSESLSPPSLGYSVGNLEAWAS